MKIRILILWGLSAMIYLGCSTDPINETLNLEVSQSQLNSKTNFQKPIVMEEFGTLKMVKPTECEGLQQFQMEGEAMISDFGKFKVMARYCTDFRNNSVIKGVLISEYKGSLSFYSNKSGVNDNGKWFIYRFYGGSGKFKGVIGKIMLYNYMDMDEDGSGVYKNYGEGVLIMPMIYK